VSNAASSHLTHTALQYDKSHRNNISPVTTIAASSTAKQTPTLHSP